MSRNNQTRRGETEAAVVAGAVSTSTVLENVMNAETPTPVGSPVQTPPAPPVTATDAIKERPEEASRPVVDRVQVTTGASGEPSSASVTTEPVPRRVAYGSRATSVAENHFAGSLPARHRVLGNGRSVDVTARPVDLSERTFTATIRILRHGTLYEPEAPVPLTFGEFQDKREARAIVEQHWDDGEDADD